MRGRGLRDALDDLIGGKGYQNIYITLRAKVVKDTKLIYLTWPFHLIKCLGLLNKKGKPGISSLTCLYYYLLMVGTRGFELRLPEPEYHEIGRLFSSIFSRSAAAVKKL
jgi:hypothetical protein